MVCINKTIGDQMGYNIKDAALMSAYQRQFPGADLNRLAALAGIPAEDVPNYVINTTATPAKNAAFGTVTSRASENTQATDTPRNTPGSGTAFQGGGTIAEQAFGKRPQPDPFPAPPPARPVQAQDSDVDFTDAYGENFRQATPIPTPVVQPQDDDVEFADAYGESFREVTPIPTDTRFPTSRTSELTQNTVDPGLANALRDQERRAIEASNAFEEPSAPSPYPAAPPARPVQSFDVPVDDFSGYPVTQVDDFSGPTRNISQVDDFSGTPVPQVDDFSGPNRNITPVDDFAEYQPPVTEVDDFAEFQSPNQVNQFGVDDFGDPEAAQFDAFGDPLRAPAAVNDFEEYGDFTDEEGEDFDAFGNPVNRVDNDGESLVGDDPTGELDDLDRIPDGSLQAAISQQQQAAVNAMAMKQRAQQQQTVNEMREASGVKNADGDWRVKLRLAPQATYLYKDPNPGILAPLAVTDGIIFPYTPTIDIQYRAEYNAYSPTHSNYQHYFYKNSSVQTVQLQAEFTAQDTIEAEYLLACIHFLKSASKMFYGQDAQRGSPPPLLYLSGLGEYQFNESPCAITEFNYNLPNDVNYIRARSRHINRNDQLQFQKPLASSTTNGNFSALNRLKTAVTNALNGNTEPLQAGAQPFKPTPGNLGSKGATYVPTKMSMTINLLPIISRQAVSQQFSLKEYANGNLIKKGMW